MLREFRVFLIALIMLVTASCGGGGSSAAPIPGAGSSSGGGNVQNSPPIANAGSNVSAVVGDTILLNGEASSDPDGDVIAYTWEFESTPAGSDVTLSNSSSQQPSFTADVAGDFVIQLTVSDGKDQSQPDTVTVQVDAVNIPPIADAGEDQNVVTGSQVTLDGSDSSDPDGDLITYSWELLEFPQNSVAELTDGTVVNPSFTADIDGDYVIRVTVSDPYERGSFDDVKITAEAPVILNSPPIANAGSNVSAVVGDTISLNGEASSDPDGDVIAYTWEFESTPAGSDVTLSNSSSQQPSFTADVAGDFVIQLTVSDGKDQSQPDTVTVQVDAVNIPPIADAGEDQNVVTGSQVTLDGSDSSDPDGDLITYSWELLEFPQNSVAELTDGTVVNPSFTADIDGDYVIRVTVSDPYERGSFDDVKITAETSNSTPVADAGPDQNVETNSIVLLDGTGSTDADNDGLTYTWSVTSVPGESETVLDDNASATPSFTADTNGRYVIALVVNDGMENSEPDEVSVTAATVNSAPVADAGSFQSVEVGDKAILDGTNSSDSDGDTLSYAWYLVSIPEESEAQLIDKTTANPSFFPDVQGSYVIGLEVSDGELVSDSDRVTVIAVSLTTPPRADAGPDKSVTLSLGGAVTVSLDGSNSSDLDGDPLTFSWRLVEGSEELGPIRPPTLALSTEETAIFTATDPGIFKIGLIVNDGRLDSTEDYVTVTVESAPDELGPFPLDSALYVWKAAGPDLNFSIVGELSPGEIYLESGSFEVRSPTECIYAYYGLSAVGNGFSVYYAGATGNGSPYLTLNPGTNIFGELDEVIAQLEPSETFYLASGDTEGSSSEMIFEFAAEEGGEEPVDFRVSLSAKCTVAD